MQQCVFLFEQLAALSRSFRVAAINM